MLFKKAVESKNMQNQGREDVLLLTKKKNRHNALIAQGVNRMAIQERESGAMEILKDKVLNRGVEYKKLVHNWKIQSIRAGKISEKETSSSLQIGWSLLHDLFTNSSMNLVFRQKLMSFTCDASVYGW